MVGGNGREEDAPIAMHPSDASEGVGFPALLLEPVPPPVFGGGHPRDGLEYPVEMCGIGKSCLPADFRNIVVCFHEFSLGIPQLMGLL